MKIWHLGEDYNCRCWAEPYIPPKEEKDGTGSADTEEYMSFGDRALAAMSGLFGISTANAKEAEYSPNNLLERGKKLPPLPARKPEYSANNLLEKDNKRQIDYSKYGPGFSKEFIDEMENDIRFHRAMDRYVNDHEGGYVNIKEDRGKETKYGITKRWYPKEDIKNITKERASAILYRDYWNYGKINTLPDDLVDIVFDNAIVQGQPTAMEHLHEALGLPKGGTIVGKESHKKLQELDHDLIKKRFIKNVQNREDEITEKNPSQKLFQKGWRIRSNHYK